MKLGEAKRKVTQLNRRLNELSVVLSHGPRGGIPGALEECNALLRDRGALERLVRVTEEDTTLEGNSLVDVQAAFYSAQQKLELINILVSREDLDEQQREKLFEQLHIFRNTRDQLERSIENCLWQTELVNA